MSTLVVQLSINHNLYVHILLDFGVASLIHMEREEVFSVLAPKGIQEFNSCFLNVNIEQSCIYARTIHHLLLHKIQTSDGLP